MLDYIAEEKTPGMVHFHSANNRMTQIPSTVVEYKGVFGEKPKVGWYLYFQSYVFHYDLYWGLLEIAADWIQLYISPLRRIHIGFSVKMCSWFV